MIEGQNSIEQIQQSIHKILNEQRGNVKTEMKRKIKQMLVI